MRPGPTPGRDIFVLGQPLFRLLDRDPETRWHAVINEAEPRDSGRRDGAFTPAFRPPSREQEPDEEPVWERLDRGQLIRDLADPLDAWRRVALVCGAGLGKTTNLSWLAAMLNRHTEYRGRQLAFDLNLQTLTDSADELMECLLRRVRNHIGGSWGGDVRLEQDLLRRRSQGRITLLLDSLDQAGPSPRGPAVQALRTLLNGVWSACPIWVSGRPHAFQMNAGLFGDDPSRGWEFVRVGQLDEPERRFLLETTPAAWRLRQTRGGETQPECQLHDELSPAAARLARVPRLARLIGRLPLQRVRQLGKTATAADVFWEVYNYCTNDDSPDTGLLADGLKCQQVQRMAWRDRSDPPDSFRPYQVQRARDLLGAIAFELLAKTDAEGRPAPWWNGVAGNLPAFQAAVKDRFLKAGALVTSRGVAEPYEGFLDQDWECLLRMDSHGLKHFIFSTDASEDQLRWTDVTTMAFFAAYWACRWATPEELEQTRRWVVDQWDDSNYGFFEFWTLAADMPDRAIDRERRIALFAPLYGRELLDAEGFPIRSTEFIYRSWKLMEGTPAQRGFLAELPALVAAENAVAAELSPAGDNPNLRPIPAGTFWMGALDDEPKAGGDDERPRHQVTLSAFRMNRYAVTNAQYELFDSGHRRHRGQFDGDMGQEFDDHRRPVVNVSWYDAWCFARWTGNRLPTEAQWEYACRGGTSSYQIFHYGNSLSSKEANFDGRYPYGNAQKGDWLKRTTVVGLYDPNGFGLYDMHGNVLEWCADGYNWYFYETKKGSASDPVNDEPDGSRVLRGGSWDYEGWECRTAFRYSSASCNNFGGFGFRLAAVPALEPSQASKGK